MPTEWDLSDLFTIYKRKGDPLDCGNFRGIKLLEHVMKILEKVIEGSLCGLVSVNDMQFGFSPGRGTMDAAFIIKQQQEKHLEVNWDLYYTVPEKLIRERSTDIRRELGVSDINKKVKEIRIRWYGHVKERRPSSKSGYGKYSTRKKAERNTKEEMER
ncbi:uncharacterized protein LOC134786444 [Penaeus indicus]|uniref:uncharacterized protein LOC134786444 n=1 Tax=Penaeus indicus TaxID=29960 RepID=UPI00300C7818